MHCLPGYQWQGWRLEDCWPCRPGTFCDNRRLQLLAKFRQSRTTVLEAGTELCLVKWGGAILLLPGTATVASIRAIVLVLICFSVRGL